MSDINTKHNKIIITGSVGAGKSTAIQTISDIAVVQTEAKATDEIKKKKDKTTVAMDFGVINLDDGQKIHIYGTPGQERFNFMWDILTKGSIGLIILVDAQSENAVTELNYFMDQFASLVKNTSVAIGLNKTGPETIGVVELRQQLTEEQLKYPIFEIDARDRTDVSMLIEALLYTINPCLKQVTNGN